MKEEKYYLFLNNDEIKIIIRSLIMLRNNLLNEGRYTDCVDEIIVKIAKVKLKKQVHIYHCKYIAVDKNVGGLFFRKELIQ